ncbi:MAG: hypothetical protein WB869_21480, partial [Candidatus Acidiferrales bacterium]
ERIRGVTGRRNSTHTDAPNLQNIGGSRESSQTLRTQPDIQKNLMNPGLQSSPKDAQPFEKLP